MNRLFALIVISLLSCISAAAECGRPPKVGPFISYAVEPKVTDRALTLNVTLTFRIKGESATLIVPSEWQGQKNLHQAITRLEVVSQGSSLRAGDEPSKRRVTFPRGEVVRIEYEVRKDWTGKIDASSYFRVMLDPSYFQVTGANFLIYPSVPNDEDLPLLLEWKNLPSDWKFVSSFSGNSECHSANTSIVKLSNGLFAAGDLRVSQVQVEGKPVFLATRGQWTFTDRAFEEIVQKILTAERLFWRDGDAPNYLITLLPSDDDPGNYGGTALEDSFALFMGPETKLDFQTKFLLAHEMFHSWNAAKLGEIRDETPFWFTEGFTDYYARCLLRRSGLISDEEYESDIKSAYTEYRASRDLHTSGARMREKFYSDSDIQRQAYLRGNFLALRWNQIIERKSSRKQSLDVAMLDLSRQAKTQEVILTTGFLASHFAKFVGPEALSDVQRFIENGETIPLAESDIPTAQLVH